MHGWSILHPGWRGPRLLKTAYGLAMRVLLLACDAVVYVCAADRHFGEVHGLTKASRGLVAYNGLPPDCVFKTRAEARRGLGLADGVYVAGTVARIDYPKHLDLLAEALNLPGGESIQTVVLGDGPHRAFLAEEVERLKLTDRWRTVSNLPEQTPYLRAFDCFVICSRYEGLPYALLEAALAGVPIVATTVGGIPEVVRHGESARLVPPNDATALAREIRWTKDHPAEAAAMAAAGRRRVSTDFTEKKMADKVEKAYGSGQRVAGSTDDGGLWISNG